jgi:hypothetical protein
MFRAAHCAMNCRAAIRRAASRFVTALLATTMVGALPAAAQQTSQAAAPASRWQAQVDKLDEALRASVYTASDPRSNWIAGQLERGDIETQVRRIALARIAAPDNRLYLATLATACLEPVQPRLPECDAVDRLADWATRDRDNGWPSLLLADRARRHGNPDAMLALLRQAAAQPRFVEYWEAGSLEIWEAVRTLPADGDEAAKLELAVMIAMTRSLAWPNAARGTCMDAGDRPDAVRATCADLGAAMRERGSTWMSRLIGGRIALANAASPEAKAAGEQKLSSVRAQIAACSRATGAILEGLEASDPATRARAVNEWDVWLRREAAIGEARACAERVGATSTAPAKLR